jgi:hypothetical protein
MHIEDIRYEKYLTDDYQIICLGGVTNLRDIEDYVVPTLRSDLPSSFFVFAFPDSMSSQYNDYIESKYGLEYRYLALGSTDLAEGIAFASEVPSAVKHEMAHLSTCGTWHDELGKDIGRVIKHEEAHLFSWCND